MKIGKTEKVALTILIAGIIFVIGLKIGIYHGRQMVQDETFNALSKSDAGQEFQKNLRILKEMQKILEDLKKEERDLDFEPPPFNERAAPFLKLALFTCLLIH